MKRQVPNCGYCDEYTCDELERLLSVCDQQEGFFSYARLARPTLKAIRLSSKRNRSSRSRDSGIILM
jgi:hypothetical protein